MAARGIKTAAGKSWTPVQVTRVRGRGRLQENGVAGGR